MKSGGRLETLPLPRAVGRYQPWLVDNQISKTDDVKLGRNRAGFMYAVVGIHNSAEILKPPTVFALIPLVMGGGFRPVTLAATDPPRRQR